MMSDEVMSDDVMMTSAIMRRLAICASTCSVEGVRPSIATAGGKPKAAILFRCYFSIRADGSWHKAAEALATQCPELAEEADISPKWGISRFDPKRR